ncbi:Thiamine-phosphate synthase [Vibrio thalassae]|uniref:Thiamine-phosphate synthase n=1 Tax=Vibrio thalassae TaxID=1243014 RepID=A0A240ENF2_9VIBR|nr:thiamine phosphate synthase [Vibrio thalassae]SNX50136.1 Thiamine-phosphate synthase [Vibrio thalassae]
MTLLIPSIHQDLVKSVRHVLSLAQSVGFDIDDIQISVVNELNVVQIENSERCQMISSDLPSVQMDNDADYRLHYHHGFVESNFPQVMHSMSFGDVYLDVDSESGRSDIWACREEVIKASSGALSLANTHQHFAWFIVAIILDFPLEDAVMLARAGSVSRETWPSTREQFFTPVIENKELGIRVGWAVRASSSVFPTLYKNSLGLYPVVDSVEWIERLLKQGIKTIQLRIKNPSLPNLAQQIQQAIQLGEQYNAQVFINDYWQLAIQYGAFGVHLGQEDIETAELSLLAENNIALGLSTHGYYELLRVVQIHPSYIALGHIFPTTTKVMPSRPQGLVRLALYQQLIDSIPYADKLGYPTVAIGGIDLQTAKPVWDCGVTSLAVVRALTLAEDTQHVIDEFSHIMMGERDGLR